MYLLTYVLIYSLHAAQSWETNQFSVSQEIPCILCNRSVHYHIYMCLPHVLIQSSCRHIYIYISYRERVRELSWNAELKHIQKSIFVVPIYREVSLEAVLWPVHWHVFVEAIIDIYLCGSRTVFLNLFRFIATSELDLSVLTPLLRHFCWRKETTLYPYCSFIH